MMSVVLLAGIGTATADMSLEEILAKNIEARGGLEKITAVQSVRASGTMTMMGGQMEVPFTWEWRRPDAFRVEFTIQGQTGTQAFDGQVAWMHMPFMGKAAPEIMPPEQARELETRSDMIDGPFINTEEKGYKLEYLGQADVDGTPAYKIKVTDKHGDVTVQYIDAEYFLQIKSEGSRKMGETVIEFETVYGDFKEVDGVMIAHSIESHAKGAPGGQTITISSMTFNVDLADDRFAFPGDDDTAKKNE